jgi:hypothetical protein
MAKINDILTPGQNVNKLDLRKYLSSREIAVPQDYGAYGDGIADDTDAINTALAENAAVFLPPGTYRTTAPVTVGYGRCLFGAGDGSVIQAREEPYDPVQLPDYPSDYNAVDIVDGYATVKDLRIVGGATGIMLYGRDGPCVKNVIENISIWDCINGLTFDGWNDTDKPCYWNNASRILVARPQINGVLFTVTPSDWEDPETFGDTPNANKLHDVRVYSLSAPMSGSGFFISAGRFHNSFLDCEANVHLDAEACFRLGFSTDENRIVNFYAECLGQAPGIRIDNGSTNTAIINLFSATGGAAIWDPTLGGEYQAYNAGFPTRNFIKDAWITDLHLEAQTLSTEFIDPPAGSSGIIDLDLETTMYLVSSFNLPLELRLPNAADATGRIVTIKKTDFNFNAITIKEIDGSGPDLREIILLNRYDTVSLMSNGANWWVLHDNLMPQNSQFVDSDDYPSGLFQPSMLHRLYVVSAFVRPMEIRLPAPEQAPGRLATIKKNDPSGNDVTVTQEGGGGPDAQSQPLTQHFQGLTVMSDGGQWFVLSRT